MREKNNNEEKIIFVSPEGVSPGYFITTMEKLSYKGILEECEWNCYSITKCCGSIATMYCDVIYDSKYEYLKYIRLVDIVVNSSWRGMGYGSQMLSLLIQYAEKLGAEYLSGRLSFVDIGTEEDPHREEKRERLARFYKRHGFTVSEDDRIFRPIKTKSLDKQGKADII